MSFNISKKYLRFGLIYVSIYTLKKHNENRERKKS